MTKDVVCGMQVDEKTAPYKSQYQGTTFYFCASECKRKFDQQPQKYAREAAQTTS